MSIPIRHPPSAHTDIHLPTFTVDAEKIEDTFKEVINQVGSQAMAWAGGGAGEVQRYGRQRACEYRQRQSAG
jgi:hypothetical protein